MLSSCSLFQPDPLAQDNGSLHYSSDGQSNIWQLLGQDLHMNHHSDMPIVQARIKWYMTNPTYLQKVAKHGAPYVYYILQELKKRQMPSEIALLPIIESGYDPFAYSSAGAAGLWQMMPGTASGMSIRQNWWYDGRRDVYASTNAALDYLQYLHKEFNGDWLLALAAYNSGDGTVEKAIRYNKANNLPTDFWHLKLPSQTQQYVPNLLALATIVANPNTYAVQWPTTQLAPFITPVKVGSQIDLAIAAKLAGISIEELYLLNPGFNRWATDPEGSHILLLPSDKADAFEMNLTKVPKNERVTWTRYRVQTGDSLGKIAKKFSTSVILIKDVNGLHNNIIHIGNTLLIPKAKKSFAKNVLNEIKHYLHHERNLPGPNRVMHVVQPGENLWTIAKAYHLSIRQIRYWNQLSRKLAIQPGTTLTLWTESKHRGDAVSLRPYVLHHTVKAHDNLQAIAKHYDVSVTKLKRVNHLSSNTIKLGQQLLIPPAKKVLAHFTRHLQNYTVKAGDNLINIAHHFDVKGSALKAYNHLQHDTLHIGQVLKIPA